MSLSTTLEQMKKSLARSQHAFAEGRARHPELAAYESPSAVLAAVDRGSSLSVEQRDDVLVALIEEAQRTPRAVWQSLLVVAFAPMLVRLRARLRRPGCSNLDQRVLVAFLETVRSFAQDSYIQRNLRLLTRARLFAEGRREQRGSDLLEFDDETYVGNPVEGDAHVKGAAAEVAAMVVRAGGEQLRDAMLARHGGGESMRDFVERAHPELDARERARLADRLYRAELVVVRNVRARTQRRERYFTPAA